MELAGHLLVRNCAGFAISLMLLWVAYLKDSQGPPWNWCEDPQSCSRDAQIQLLLLSFEDWGGLNMAREV